MQRRQRETSARDGLMMARRALYTGSALASAALALAVGACSVDAKEAFLASLDGQDGAAVGDATGASDAVSGDVAAGDATTATGDSTTTVVDGTTTPGDATSDATPGDDGDATTSPDDSTTTVVDDATGNDATLDDAATTDVPSGGDATMPDDALVGWGWRVPLGGLAVARPFVFTAAGASAVALPVVNGSALELRTWKADGGGLWSATLATGTALELAGGDYCGGSLLVSAVEHDGSKAVVTSLDPGGTKLAAISFYPKTGTTGGSVTVGAPGCGGPGAWLLMDPVGAVTYKAPGGGVVQLTAEQTLNRSFIVDLTDTFGAVGTLGTVSADKIGVGLGAAASHDAKTLYYVGEVRATKQLGATTLQPGDELVYAHDYAAATGGTATSTVFYGGNDILALAPAPDGRFAVAWKVAAPEEQRVTAFDADGKALGVAVVGKSAPIGDLRWDGDTVVVAGTFSGVPPLSIASALTSGSYIAVMQVGATMTVIRGAAFEGGQGPLGLHRVALAGACSGSGWGVMTSGPDGLGVGALGNDGTTCRSELLEVSGAPLAAALDVVGEYLLATPDELARARIRPGLLGGAP